MRGSGDEKRWEGGDESAGVGRASAAGEEREAKKRWERSRRAGKQQRDSRLWEEGTGQKSWGRRH